MTFSKTIVGMVLVVEVVVVVSGLVRASATSIFYILSLIYPSATDVDFHPPCFFLTI